MVQRFLTWGTTGGCIVSLLLSGTLSSGCGENSGCNDIGCGEDVVILTEALQKRFDLAEIRLCVERQCRTFPGTFGRAYIDDQGDEGLLRSKDEGDLVTISYIARDDRTRIVASDSLDVTIEAKELEGSCVGSCGFVRVRVDPKTLQLLPGDPTLPSRPPSSPPLGAEQRDEDPTR